MRTPSSGKDVRMIESRSRPPSPVWRARVDAWTAAPLGVMALGAAIYVVSAVGTNVWVVQQPQTNTFAQIALIVLLSLGLVTVLEGLLGLLDITPREGSFGWPYRAACLACVAYSLTYGPYVFVNMWWYDDWGYLAPDQSFSPKVLTWVLNDHLNPLLNVILWTATNTFGLDYIGIACLQHGVFVLLLLAVAHLLWAALKNVGWLVFFLVTYASWPTHGDSRFWLGGGFWLSASASFLMVYLLHAQSRMMAEKPLTVFALSVSFALASMTVFISSQTMIPVVYLLCLVFPTIVIAREPVKAMRRLGTLAGLSLVPTVLIFIGRSIYVQRAGWDLSGLVHGDLIRNAVLFFARKVVPLRGDIHGLKYQTEAGAAFALLFVVPIALALGIQFAQWRKGEVSGRGECAARLGLILLGCALIGVLFTQIGAARNWLTEAVLGSYYATLPLLAYWLASAGAWATLVPAIASRVRGRPRPKIATALVGIVLFVLVAVAIVSIHKQTPLRERVEKSQQQLEFLQHLGTAMCSLAAAHPGQSVAWRPKYAIDTDCPLCLSIVAPTEYRVPNLLAILAPLAARRECARADADRIIGSPHANADMATDGAENAQVRRFYEDYFVPRR
jgi:hypothetical protein